MNKLFPLAGMLLLLAALPSQNLFSQAVILVNGQPTEVILNGEQIEVIVTHQIKNYMQEYGQETNDDFVKSMVNLNHHKETAQADILTEQPIPPSVMKETRSILVTEVLPNKNE